MLNHCWTTNILTRKFPLHGICVLTISQTSKPPPSPQSTSWSTLCTYTHTTTLLTDSLNYNVYNTLSLMQASTQSSDNTRAPLSKWPLSVPRPPISLQAPVLESPLHFHCLSYHIRLSLSLWHTHPLLSHYQRAMLDQSTFWRQWYEIKLRCWLPVAMVVRTWFPWLYCKKYPKLVTAFYYGLFNNHCNVYTTMVFCYNYYLTIYITLHLNCRGKSFALSFSHSTQSSLMNHVICHHSYYYHNKF